MEMSITRALRELTLLDDRINNKVRENYIGYAKKESKDIQPGKTKQDFISEVKENMQSLKDLIKRRELIKSKICESNQNTLVNFNNKEIKVIDAINYKDTIEYKKQLLSNLRRQYTEVLNGTDNHNKRVEEQANSLTSQAISKESNRVNSETDKMLVEAFINSHSAEVVDPLKIEKLIKDLVEEIEKFESEMDYILSESNARTVIEIED